MDLKKLSYHLKTNNHEVISYRYHRIVKVLNEYYWGIQSDSKNCRYVGSYGRGTAIKGFSDVDIIVKLPIHEYQRFTNYSQNGQSALLQDVKRALDSTYSRTLKKGDGQVVVVEFSDGIKFEIVPSFVIDGKITYPDSNKNGAWKQCDPVKEIEAINLVNKATDGWIKDICRLTRAWKEANQVEISGILIDNLAIDFMINNREKIFFTLEIYFGFYLLHLVNQRDIKYWILYGSGDVIARNKFQFEDKALVAASELLKLIQATNYTDKKHASEKLFGNIVNEVMI
ncbi:nucleotidyltransferase domain-containing protein [Cytobacillus solani]|uniref:SMODS domain-containing nucleotidyltransferase n=1 Tax=Cytobacillus solani TaxID=1637975 RepID=UPI00114E2D64|nr:nucleotidyltransferase domain-containing protein [Cytobacillus solani]